MTDNRPRPVVDHLSEPFWRGCREHQLRLQKCLNCQKRRFPAGPVCLECGSAESEWVTAESKARVYSWIVVRHPVPADVYADAVPYVVALVEFSDGVRMPTNIIGCTPEEISAEMEVDVEFSDIDDSLSLPHFRPVAKQSQTKLQAASGAAAAETELVR